MMKENGKTKSEKVRASLLFAFSLLLFTFAANAETVYVSQANIGNCRALHDGGIYWFMEDVDFTAAGLCESALKVDGGARVEIVVPKNVMVKLTGGAANGTTGADAKVVFPEVKKPSDAAGFFSIGVKETPGITPSDGSFAPITIKPGATVEVK